MTKKVPLLYANCVPVKGANSSVIYDLQRNSYVRIPLDLFHILKFYRGMSILDIKKKYDTKFDDIIDEYFNVLIENEFAFLTDTPELFPQIKNKWDSPFKITNAIIDIKYEQNNTIDVLTKLSELNCKFVQLRFFKKVSFEEISKIFSKLDEIEANIIGIDICLTFNRSFEDNLVLNFCKENRRLSTIVLYNSPKGKNIAQLDGTRYIIHTSKELISEKNCGVIDNTMFSINIKNFTESLNYNSCLNGKISIDVNGNIKNCPAMPQSFGNIVDTTLEEALKHKDFKRYWNITKDQISVCKDCEFRYVCTDCRAYIENPDDQYSKPLKCGYSPYTNVWEEWSTNLLKQNTIEHYRMQDLVNRDD